MATESPAIHDGSQNVAGFDARNATLTGTTLSGPNGSGQFLVVRNSTTSDRTLNLSTVTGMRAYGVCQNKPSTGIAIDAIIFGITKIVAGASITGGSEIMTTSTASGTVISFSSAVGQTPCGRALETAVVGQVFTALWYGGPAAPGGV